MCALLAAFVCVACVAFPLAAQEVIVMQPALFDLPDNPDQPDTPPRLVKFWQLIFPDKLRSAKEPGYAIYTQALDENGRMPLDEKGKPYGWGVTNMSLIQCARWSWSDLQWTPALKNGVPVKSLSWIGIIFNLPSASEKNANATPRILKIAPILYKRKELAGLSEISLWDIRVAIKVGADGTVKDFKFKTNTSFTRAMRPKIERSLAQWQFAPARKNGRPVEATLTISLALYQDPIDAEQELERQTNEHPLTMPELVERVDPIFYPSGMSGTVIVAFAVDTEGKTRDITVVRSSNEYLERPAMDAVRQWKFKPAIGKDGKPMKMRMQVPIQFKPR